MIPSSLCSSQYRKRKVNNASNQYRSAVSASTSALQFLLSLSAMYPVTNRGNIIPIIPDGLPDIFFGHLRLRVFQRNRHGFLQAVRLRKAHVKTIAHDVWFLSFTNKKQAHPKMSLPECLQIMNCTNAGLRLNR